ncbi:radical SAM family heme chaperone HemW [Amaricoccus tamworthensis]|uniref:radical SAM family heme chaperone HemW n=1 Tax=Amaricoccus tamworthensis TaxID=57002 RepID=UPI003C7DC547
MPEDWQHGGFGVYVHWPFCAAKCPYCDFNSHVRKTVDQDRWARALVREIETQAEITPNRVVNSVFFGGGTPSLMDPKTVGAVLDAIANSWTVANDIEVSLEANPTSVEAERFRSYRSAGVNRLSMGIQALNNRDLKALGRMHTAEEAISAFEIARTNFNRVSFDLIYARQNQTLADWRSELSTALDMAVDHLSLYQLTIEPNTRFGEMDKRGILRGIPSDNASADMYELTQEICSKYLMHGYEVSNHARSEAECRHNLIYWRYGDYAGIGPGAHGRYTRRSNRYGTVAWSNPEKWLSEIEAQNTGIRSTTPLDREDQAREMMLMGLRLKEGISLSRYKNLAGRDLNQASIHELEHLGMLEREDDRVKVTSQGRPVLNSVLNNILNQ